MTRSLIVAGALWLLGSATVAAADEKPPIPARESVYVVQPGDTCSSIANKVWPNDPDGLEKLHSYNEMGPNPHKLVPGTKLRIVSTVPDATLTFVKPDVNVRKGGNQNWALGAVGQGLFHQDQVSTLAGAAAEVLFKDHSSLQLDQNALVVIYAATRGATGPERSGDIELVQGDLRLHLAALRGEAPQTVSVKTPSGNVSATSKNISVGVDAQKMSRVSVFDGKAAVAALGKTVDVQKGFGTRVALGKEPEVPQPLPPSPPWTTPGPDQYLVLTKEGYAPTVAWTAVESGVRYRLEVARDQQFNGKVVDMGYNPDQLKVKLPRLPVAQYYARVSAYNAAGLLGASSQVRPIAIDLLRVDGGWPDPKTGTIHGANELRILLPEGVHATLDGQPVTSPIVVTGMAEHPLRLTRDDGSLVGAYNCIIDPPRVKIAFNPKLTEVQVAFFDSQGHPASFTNAPDLGIMGLGGTEVGVLKPIKEGHVWAAPVKAVQAMSSTKEATVRILWQGREIGNKLQDEQDE